MTSTLPQSLFLILTGLTVIALSEARPPVSDQGAALLVALVCAVALWIAGNWRPS